MEGNFQTFTETLDRWGVKTRLIQKNSDDAVSDVEDKSCDVIFIDGNHSYEFCKNDLNNYAPKLVDGGFLLVHDYNTRFTGVIKAVEEFAEEWGCIFEVLNKSSIAFFGGIK